MQIDPAVSYRQVTMDVQQRSIGGVTVLHRSTWDEPVALNHTLHVVWTCLAVGGTPEEIERDIVELFGISPEAVRAHVHEALHQLAELELIEPETDETTPSSDQS